MLLARADGGADVFNTSTFKRLRSLRTDAREQSLPGGVSGDAEALGRGLAAHGSR